MTACLLLLGLTVACSVSRGPVPAPVAPAPIEATGEPDPWLAEDKLQHLAASFAATTMAYGGARLALEPEPGRRAAVAASLALGVGKELLDARGGGTFSFKDLAWDVAGVALGYTLARRIR